MRRLLHPTDAQVVRLLLEQQYEDLPRPSSVVIEPGSATLTVDTCDAVEAWAKAMQVDADYELHTDGTWTDSATGVMEVVTPHGYRDELRVTVYRPAISLRGEWVA